MPSSKPLPEIPALLEAFHAGVASEQKTEDSHDGSIYDRFAGAGALAFRRLAERDQGMARAIFFDTAADTDLDYIIDRRFQTARVQDAPGVGTVTLARANAGAGGGVFPQGTRIEVSRGPTAPRQYWKLAANTTVGSELSATLDVVAAVNGPDGQIAVKAGQVPVLGVADPLWDNSWTVTSLDCAAGTVRQRDPEVRAVIRQRRVDGRPGYEKAIFDAMIAAGASVVAMYQGDYLGDELDFGLNRVFVGDASYESPPALLTRCRLALANVAMAGASVQALPMTNALLYVTVSVKLWAAPETLNRVQYEADAVAAVTEYFSRRDNAFLWSQAAARAAVMKAVPNVHSVTVQALTSWSGSVVPEPTPATLFDTIPIKRYGVADWSVRATVAGPT